MGIPGKDVKNEGISWDVYENKERRKTLVNNKAGILGRLNEF
jgi:hypothetical protein